MRTTAALLAGTAVTLVTVDLDQPIARDAGPVESVQLRKPNAGELRGLSLKDIALADTAAMIELLPRITVPPLTEEEVAVMDLADFLECANQVSGFLPQRGRPSASPKT